MLHRRLRRTKRSLLLQYLENTQPPEFRASPLVEQDLKVPVPQKSLSHAKIKDACSIPAYILVSSEVL
jgi:hypothetical protein